MTTFVSTGAARGVSWNTANTNATFQAWATRVKAALDGCGLVQTSDTGQMNVATATYPSSNNADAGYLIYRFNDSVQGTDPIFLRFGLGRGSVSAATRLTLTIGQGSNGSGTLTGITIGAQTLGNTYATIAIDPTTTNYACHQDGYLGVAIQALPVGRSEMPRHWFIIQRTRNPSTEAFDSQGYVLHMPGYNPATDMTACIPIIWSVGGVQYSAAGAGYYDFTYVVGSVTTDVNGDYIAWPHLFFDRGVVRQCWATWTTHVDAFVTNSATAFDASPYGTSRRWLSLGSSTNPRGTGVSGTTSWVMPLLWEA